MHTKTAAILAAVVTMGAAAATAEAQSASTCSFDGPSATLTVTVNGLAADLTVGATGGIRLNGAVCTGARVTTTDTIAVAGGGLADTVTFTGTFAPGLTPEGGGGSEIEIQVALGGGADQVASTFMGGGDLVTFTAGGIDVGGDFDQDISLTGVETVDVNGGGGDDDIDASLYAGPAALVLRGGVGADTLLGSPAADVFVGGPGNDTMMGGAGDDVFKQGTASDGADQVAGEGGIDTIDYSGRTSPVVVALNDDVATSSSGEVGEGDVIQPTVERGIGGQGADSIYVGGRNQEGLGGPGDDELSGSFGPQVLRGGPGDDRLAGSGGNDDLYGDDGADLLYGNAGDDLLYGGAGADVLNGASGDDVLYGGPGPDFLEGGHEYDQYFGEGGNDRIDSDGGSADPEPEVVDCGAGAADDTRSDPRDTFIGCELWH